MVCTLKKTDKRGKFHRYSICGCQVKNFKVLRTDSASMKWLFLGGYWTLTPQIWSNFVEIFTIGSNLANRNVVWKFCEGFKFIWKRDGPKVWPPVSSWRWPKSKTISCSEEKRRQPLGHSNMSKSRLYISSPLFGKNTNYFLHYLGYFWQETGRVIIQRVFFWTGQNGQNQSLTQPISPACKRILVPTLSSFSAIGHKGHFRKILTQIFKFGCFFWYHAYIFETKWVRFSDAELNAASIGTNFKS